MIYLVRHCVYEHKGKIIAGRLPLALSAEGITQAEKLRDFFSDKNIEAIYTSPVLRARQTAEIVGSAVLSPIPDLRLAETFSAYQGMRYETEVDEHDLYAHRESLGGENMQDQQERMISFWQDLADKETKNIVIVSHGHPLWALSCFLADTPLEASIEETGHVDSEEYQRMGWIRPVLVENGNIHMQPLVQIHE